jgi:hypothetical protein
MIERVTTLDVYSHLRVEVRERGARHQAETIDVDAEQIPPPIGRKAADNDTSGGAEGGQDGNEGDSNSLTFMQSGVGTPDQAGNNFYAQEVQKALAPPPSLPRDWRLAQLVRMYSRSGRAASMERESRVGVNLNTFA